MIRASTFASSIVGLASIFVGLSSAAAMNDASTPILACPELRHSTTQNTFETCKAHTGCALFLQARKNCSDAQTFLRQVQSHLAGKKEITNEVVFYAAMPRLTRSGAMEARILHTRSYLEDLWTHERKGFQGTRTYKNDAGEITYYYEGGVKDELRHGVGIMLSRNGTARYGQFIDSTHRGLGWTYSPNGSMFVGDFVGNEPFGNVAFQNGEGGSIFVGSFVSRKWTGVVGIVIGRDGSHWKGFYDDKGDLVGSLVPGNTPDQDVEGLAKSSINAPPKPSPSPNTAQSLPSGKPQAVSSADSAKLAKNLSSRTESTYTTVCDRNWEKIYDILRESGIRNAGATYDLFMQDLHLHMAKLFEPCKATDQKSAEAYAEAMENYNKIRNYCTGPHQKWECTQWGASGGKSYNQGSPFDNIEYMRIWKGEVNKAVSDPNYSAEYGRIKWTGKSSPADMACYKGLRDIASQYNAEKKNIPESSIVVLSEATMWKIARSIELVSAKCPNSSEYLPEVSRFKHVYAEIQRACDASSSAPPCVPRLPGKPSVQAPATGGKPLAPLKKPAEESCGLPPSANAVKCLEAKCAKQDGKLSLDKKGCAHCNTPRVSDYWFICPTGVGGAR